MHYFTLSLDQEATFQSDKCGNYPWFLALPKGQLSIFWRTRAASASGQQLFLAANKSEQLDSSDKADAQQAMSGLLRAAGLRSVSG
jgi:hypothetical protein